MNKKRVKKRVKKQQQSETKRGYRENAREFFARENVFFLQWIVKHLSK
jgi:hypothetical protein